MNMSLCTRDIAVLGVWLSTPPRTELASSKSAPCTLISNYNCSYICHIRINPFAHALTIVPAHMGSSMVEHGGPGQLHGSNRGPNTKSILIGHINSPPHAQAQALTSFGLLLPSVAGIFSCIVRSLLSIIVTTSA